MPVLRQIHQGARRVLQERVKEQGTHPDGTTFDRTYWETTGYESANVEIIIDTDVIFRKCGHRALKNKSGSSKFMHGGVTVKVVGPRKVHGAGHDACAAIAKAEGR